MSKLPINLTVVGDGTTNPAIPSHNFRATLNIENGNIVITSGDFTYKIPLEHIDKLSPYSELSVWGDEWRIIVFVFFTLGTLFWGFPFLLYLLYWEYTSTEVSIVITAWDEHHGLTSTTILSLGKKRSYRTLAPKIVQEIWDKRGIVRRDDNRGRLVYRMQ